MSKISFIKIFTILILIIINIFLLLNWNYYRKEKNDFSISFIDVGQGNSTLIKYKNKLNILIDSGKDFYARKNFYKNISFFENNLDLVFASHYDLDHVGNLLNYFQKYKISYFFVNGKISKAPIYSELKKIAEKEKIKFYPLSADEVIKIDNDFYIKVLFPEKNINKNSLRDNSSSLVLQIFYKNKIFLITGDAPQKIEKWLVKKYAKTLKSDILLAGHHGSKTSTSEIFLKYVKPEYIIFSAGKNNPYHHPNKKVLDLVRKLNIKYFRTDEVGTIHYIFKNNKWKIKFN